ncbi:insulinase family protein [Myxococcota bacterium]|nr:insulinase family protein [Myxococcota bacterium]
MSLALHSLLLSLTLGLGCGPKEAPVAAADARASAPAPLPPRPFQLPEPVEGTLSNGLRVIVVENHEVPLVHVNVVLRPGAWTDPAGRPGLASVTLDMMNEGAGGMTAAELSAATRKLGASLGTAAGLDGAVVSVSALRDQLPHALPLLATVLLQPDFPQADWEILRKKRLQDLAAARNDPGSIADRTWDVLGHGGRYAGHLTTEAAYQAMTAAEMKAWHQAHVAPRHAVVTVGGDTTWAEIQPLLEQHLGGWTSPGQDLPPVPTVDGLPVQAATRIFLVDKPGAAQSVLRVGRFVGARTEADHWPMTLANMAVGGMFTARINMNLREDKGWTYGARSWIEDSYLPGRWGVGANVVTPHTADAVSEILRELTQSRAGRPISQAELDNARGYLLGTWPLRFENPGTLMSETVAIWRYGLPEDWLRGTPDAVRAVTVEQAQAAWTTRVDPAQLDILVVGDAATVRAPLQALGLPVVDMLPDGLPAGG